MHPHAYNALRASYFTISTKGGVGKTLNGSFVIHAHELAGIPLKVLEYDPVQPLRKIYPNHGVESRAVGISFEQQLGNPTAAMEYLAPLIEELRNTTTISRIIDLGGPMAEPLLDAMRLAELGETIENQGAHLRPIIPTTTDLSDLEAAAKVYRDLRLMFPQAEIAFVISERHGPASSLDGSGLMDTLRKDSRTRIVVLPICKSAYLAPLYGHARLSFTQMTKLTPADLREIPCEGASETFARHYIKSLREWISGALSAYGDFLPQPTQKAA